MMVAVGHNLVKTNMCYIALENHGPYDYELEDFIFYLAKFSMTVGLNI
jgi:hypothetical protein